MIGQILIEATVVGVSTVIMGTIVGFIVGQLVTSSVPKGSVEWNKYHVMEIALFFTGFLLHIFYEVAGLNARYCKDIFPNSRK